MDTLSYTAMTRNKISRAAIYILYSMQLFKS